MIARGLKLLVQEKLQKRFENFYSLSQFLIRRPGDDDQRLAAVGIKPGLNRFLVEEQISKSIGKFALTGEAVVVIDIEKRLVTCSQITDPAHIQFDLRPAAPGEKDGVICQEDDFIRKFSQKRLEILDKQQGIGGISQFIIAVGVPVNKVGIKTL